MRVYNLSGRRDNKYKARIKILVHETGIEKLSALVDAEFERLKDGNLSLPSDDIRAIESYFKAPELMPRPEGQDALLAEISDDPVFAAWVERNTNSHKNEDYTSLTISLKTIGAAPGDASSSPPNGYYGGFGRKIQSG